MIISSASDYREAARRRVPPFMFHYADGGSYAEQTLARNVSDLENIALRQRVLKDMSELDTSIELFGEKTFNANYSCTSWGVRNVCASWRSTSSTSGGQ